MTHGMIARAPRGRVQDATPEELALLEGLARAATEYPAFAARLSTIRPLWAGISSEGVAEHTQFRISGQIGPVLITLRGGRSRATGSRTRSELRAAWVRVGASRCEWDNAAREGDPRAATLAYAFARVAGLIGDGTVEARLAGFDASVVAEHRVELGPIVSDAELAARARRPTPADATLAQRALAVLYPTTFARCRDRLVATVARPDGAIAVDDRGLTERASR